MVEKLDHIGIAVPDLEVAEKLYSQILGSTPHFREVLEEQKVEILAYRVGDIWIELLRGTTADSPVSKFIAKRGPGIHHICFQVENIEAALAALKQSGFTLIDNIPRTGAGGRKVAFIHPQSTNGVLLELVEEAEAGRQ